MYSIFLHYASGFLKAVMFTNAVVMSSQSSSTVKPNFLASAPKID